MESETLIGQRVFGGYVVTRPIGAGGMGEVYLVENVDLQKQLVIKVLLPEQSSSAELVERFLAEARAASAIRHRHIVEILDCSTLADGRPYILMEFLEGETLFSFGQRKGLISPEITLAITAQVCSGLEAAHQRGVVHRDIKPANIYITPKPDNHYFTKILDFGIAKLEDPRLAGGVHTRSVMIAGTPHYMSPEQARTLHGVDQRTDIYAVGVVAYELLTGRVPYDAHSIGELVFQQTRTTPPMVHELRPDVPPGLSTVISQAMAMEADDRPSSARDLAMMLIAATPDGTRIAKEAAPLLFTRGVTVSGQVGVPLSVVEAQVSEIRSEPPRHRQGTSSRPPSQSMSAGASQSMSMAGNRFGTGLGGRPPTAGVRKTEILPEGARRTAAAAMAGGPRPPKKQQRTQIAPLGNAPVGTRPPAMPSYMGQAERRSTPAAPAAPPVARAPERTQPPVANPGQTTQAPGYASTQITGLGERKKPSNLRWVIIALVLVAAIGAAIAIGLFTGPQKLGDSESAPGKDKSSIGAGDTGR